MQRDEALRLGKRYFQEHPGEMVSLYKDLYGETICDSCPGKDAIGTAFDYMKRNAHKPICKYKLKPEKKRISNAEGSWTNYNMTDEIAERLIAQGYGDYFI